MDLIQYYSSDYYSANAYAQVFGLNSSTGQYTNWQPIKDYATTEWVYGEVHINDYRMNDYTNEVRQAILIHEMMHVYGAKDIANLGSIMYWKTPLVTYLTSDANDVLNRKY